jgi:hypothetical protein
LDNFCGGEWRIQLSATIVQLRNGAKDNPKAAHPAPPILVRPELCLSFIPGNPTGRQAPMARPADQPRVLGVGLEAAAQKATSLAVDRRLLAPRICCVSPDNRGHYVPPSVEKQQI